MFLQFFVSNGLAQCEGVDVTPALSSVFWDANLNLFNKCLVGEATTGTINFTENTPDTYNSAIASYSINWGDGTSTIVASTVPWTSSGSQVNTSDENWGSIAHSYAAGQYTLVYTLTTSTGCTIVRNYTVFVGSTPASPGVSFPPNGSSCAPVTLPFTLGNFSNNPIGTTYVLTFNDNSTPQTFTQQTIPTVINHTFTTSSCGFTSGGLPNVFGAQLIATNACGSASGSASNLHVSIAPTAAITGPQEACVGSAVLYNNTSDTGETVNGASCGTEYGFVWEVLDASGNVIAPGSEYSLLSGFLGSNFADPNDYLLWTNGSVQLGLAFNTSGTYTVRLKARNSCPDESVMFQTILINSQSCPCVGASPTATITPVGSTTFCQGGSVVLNANTGTGFMYQWYNNASPISGATSSSYTANASGSYSVGVTNTSSCSATSSATNVVVNPSPTFTTQPAATQSVCVGGTTNQMCVTYANGTGTPAYQWYSNTVNSTINGTAVSGATASCFTPPSTTSGTTYYYSIINLSGGGCSSITSNTAEVIVIPNPVLTAQPLSSQTICVGGTIPAALSVAYTGGIGTPTYQWYTGTPASAISGATNASYTPPAFTTSGTFGYYATITLSGSGCGSTTSQVATVVVVADPTATISPGASYCQNAGTVVALSVVVSNGQGTPSYQWYSNTVNSNVGGTAISGATAISYSPSVAATGTTYYYCMISQSGTNCSVNSPTAQIIVTPAPTFTIQPVSTQSVCVGVTTTQLSVAYSNGTGAASYQWYSNTSNMYNGGVPISAATSSVYTPPSSSAGTTYYYCIVSFSTGGGCSMINSNIAQVIVDPSLCGGNTAQANFSMDTQGCSPYVIGPVNTSVLNASCANTTYQWNITPSNSAFAQFVAGTNSSSTSPVIQFIEPGNYTVTLTLNSCGIITTASQQILIETTPNISLAAATSCLPYSYAPGVNVAEVSVISNSQVNNLNWSVTPSAGVQIFNGSTTTPTIQFNQSGTYTIQLEGSNICGTNTSQAQVEVLGAAISYYQDSDSDSFGNTNVEIVDCIQPVGYVLDNTDCDDSNAAVNPNAEEIGANGIDENCDGQIDNSIFELNAKISLYPNPTRSELNIQINSSIIGNDLYIFDAVGKLVFKQQLLSTQTTIPVSNFADGNYVVRVGEVVKRFEVMK